MNPQLQEYLGSQMAAFLNFIYDGVYVVDTDRNLAFWNKGAETLTGYASSEVLGRCCRDNILNHIDGAGTLLCEGYCPLQKALDTGAFCEATVYPLHKDGHRFPVEVHIGPIWGSGGGIVGAVEVFRDISVEERFRAIEAKFRQVIHRYVSDVTYEAAQAAATEASGALASVKEMTVLFVDIVGFTALSERLGAERTVELLNGFFSSTSLGVRLHTGDIDKFIGDCALALFADARDAVAASEDFLSRGLPELNRSLAEKGLPPVAVRIGINSGSLVQGTIGTEDRRDLTVIGDVVNTASRVETAAAPGTYLITEATLARLADQQRFVFDREILLKGKTLSIRVFRPRS